jgi:disulfide bond formation protein DsbB
MVGGQLVFLVSHLNILSISFVLLGGFVVQFGYGEFPCPLCILQRMAMMLCALGPAYVILYSRDGVVKWNDFVAGYGLTLIAAVSGGLISFRHILLHIVPPDPGYGSTVWGYHPYTWALLVFVMEVLTTGILFSCARNLESQRVEFGRFSKCTMYFLGAIVMANLVAVFFEEGFHWFLDDNPTQYRLL